MLFSNKTKITDSDINIFVRIYQQFPREKRLIVRYKFKI